MNISNYNMAIAILWIELMLDALLLSISKVKYLHICVIYIYMYLYTFIKTNQVKQ